MSISDEVVSIDMTVSYQPRKNKEVRISILRSYLSSEDQDMKLSFDYIVLYYIMITVRI